MIKKDTELKLRIDTPTLEAAKAKAERLDIPLSQIVRQLLRGWIAEDEQPEEGEKPPDD